MVEGYYRQVVEVLRALGYKRVDGGKGSHEKWQSPDASRSVTVPRNLYSRHTANGILKDAGLTKKF